MHRLRWASLLVALFLTPLPGQAWAAGGLNLTFTGVASSNFQDSLLLPGPSGETVSFAGQPVALDLTIGYPHGTARVTAFTVSWSNQTFTDPVLTSFSGVGGVDAFLSTVNLAGGAVDISASSAYIGAFDGFFSLGMTYALSAPQDYTTPFTEAVTGGGSMSGDVNVLPSFGGYDNTFSGDFTLTSLTVSPAPEPAVWAMMIVGLLGIGGALRIRARRFPHAV